MLFTCDEDMLFSVFSNILTNCVRYAQNRITITAFQRKSPGSLTIRISNDGLGLKALLMECTVDLIQERNIGDI